MGFGLCHRCRKYALEQLRGHSFCWECSYSPETDVALSSWSSHEYLDSKVQSRKRIEANRQFHESVNDFRKNEVGGA